MSDKELSVEEAKAMVLARHRYAECVHESMTYVWRIIEDSFVLATSLESEGDSWVQAAHNLRTLSAPVEAQSVSGLGDGKWDQLRRLAEAATPGPWEGGSGESGTRLYVYCDDALGSAVCTTDLQYARLTAKHANTSFIAAANPATVLELLAENARLRAAQAPQGSSPAVAEAGERELPPCPNLAPIAAIGKDCGYVIAEHGSKQRDYDLIAIPWTDEAIPAEALVSRLCVQLGASVIGDVEQKPHGRVAVILQRNRWEKHWDLSIAARQAGGGGDELREAVANFIHEWDMSAGDGFSGTALVCKLRAALSATPKAGQMEADRA